jgi:hypothetical protein
MIPHGARLAAAALALAGAACQGGERAPAELRQFTENLVIRVSSDPQPPRAREAIVWKIVVRDKETGQPIENGEGRIFATSRDGASTWDGLEPGPELGTYYGRLRFVTAGEWAVAIQFRKDSTQRLERVDWMQDVRGARGEPGP